MGALDLVGVAQLFADRSRLAMLELLLDGREHAVARLAGAAGVSPSTAHGHLARLERGGLVVSRRQGRERLVRLAGSGVAAAHESLSLLAGSPGVQGLRGWNLHEELRGARTCYDHLAGELGVGLTDALTRQGVLTSDGGCFVLTVPGERRLDVLGVDVGAARSSHRAFARQCIDWTERRPHLAGALGAAVAQRLFELDWIERVPGGRALSLTPQGAGELRARFALSF